MHSRAFHPLQSSLCIFSPTVRPQFSSVPGSSSPASVSRQSPSHICFASSHMTSAQVQSSCLIDAYDLSCLFFGTLLLFPAYKCAARRLRSTRPSSTPYIFPSYMVHPPPTLNPFAGPQYLAPVRTARAYAPIYPRLCATSAIMTLSLPGRTMKRLTLTSASVPSLPLLLTAAAEPHHTAPHHTPHPPSTRTDAVSGGAAQLSSQGSHPRFMMPRLYPSDVDDFTLSYSRGG